MITRRTFVVTTIAAIGGPNPIEASRSPQNFSVKAFGAVGNSTSDDTKPIQAAIDAASASGGGTVFFPSGIYHLKTQGVDDGNGYNIRIRDNIKLVGDNRGNTELRGAIADTSILYASKIGQITVRHLILNGSKVSENGACIKFLSVGRAEIEDVQTSASRIGFQLLGCRQVSLINCAAFNHIRDRRSNDARGFSVGDLDSIFGTADVRFVGCKSENCADHGYSIFTRSANVDLSDCHATANDGIGFRVDTSGKIQFTRCGARFNEVGFDISSRSVRFMDCQFEGNRQAALRLPSTSRLNVRNFYVEQ